MKICSQCKENKPLTEFWKNRANCRQCCSVYQKEYSKKNAARQAEKSRQWREDNPDKHKESRKRYRENNSEKIKAQKAASANKERDRRFQREYGISLEDYNAIFEMQSGVCAICRSPPKKRWLCVDHCHTTGKVRGLLCFNCNTILGKAAQNTRLLEAAITYLRVEGTLMGRERVAVPIELEGAAYTPDELGVNVEAANADDVINAEAYSE